MHNNRWQIIFLTNFLILFQFFFNNMAFGMELKTSPFALYEQGQKDIYIDGVRTKYGLGVVGVAVETNLGSALKIHSRLGYGYHPNASVSLTVDDRSVAVKGPVSGIYIEAGIKYPLWSKLEFSVVSELRSSWRNVDAQDLVGLAGSRAITGEAVNDFDTLDLLLSAQFPLGKTAFMNVTGGLSQWNLKTTAVAYSQTGGSGIFSCPCSYTKRLDTKSSDPIFGISITSNNPRHNFSLELYNRSLKSKAGTQIIGLEASYAYQF
jgi:hypothetical protein